MPTDGKSIDFENPPEGQDETLSQPEEKHGLPANVPLPDLEGERRKQARRQADRQGKYDRRRNRCMHCSHFQEEVHTGKGYCGFHQVAMAAYAFACPNFEGLQPEPKK
jgi:hypothetical protein